MIGFPGHEERGISFVHDLNATVDYTSSRIEELEKRVAKDEAFREWVRDVEYHDIRNCVAFFVGDRGYGPWYRREAWENVKNVECTPHAVDVFDYLYDRYPKLEAK